MTLVVSIGFPRASIRFRQILLRGTRIPTVFCFVIIIFGTILAAGMIKVKGPGSALRIILYAILETCA